MADAQTDDLEWPEQTAGLEWAIKKAIAEIVPDMEQQKRDELVSRILELVPDECLWL